MHRRALGLSLLLTLAVGMFSPFVCCLGSDCTPADRHPCCPQPADETSIQAVSCCGTGSSTHEAVVATPVATALVSSALAAAPSSPVAVLAGAWLRLPAPRPPPPTTRAALSQVLLI